MRVTLADSAVHDLEDTVAHYVEQGVPNVGADLVAKILDRIETLREYPDVGRIVPEFENPRLRELIQPTISYGLSTRYRHSKSRSDLERRKIVEASAELTVVTWSASQKDTLVSSLLALIAKSSKHENAKQPHWAQARSSCWGTRSPPL